MLHLSNAGFLEVLSQCTVRSFSSLVFLSDPGKSRTDCQSQRLHIHSEYRPNESVPSLIHNTSHFELKLNYMLRNFSQPLPSHRHSSEQTCQTGTHTPVSLEIYCNHLIGPFSKKNYSRPLKQPTQLYKRQKKTRTTNQITCLSSCFDAPQPGTYCWVCFSRLRNQCLTEGMSAQRLSV